MCQPVSQSLSRVFTPSMRPNRKTKGMRKAKSVSDGNSLTANWELLASISFSTPSRNWLPVASPQRRGSDRGTNGNPYSSLSGQSEGIPLPSSRAGLQFPDNEYISDQNRDLQVILFRP